MHWIESTGLKHVRSFALEESNVLAGMLGFCRPEERARGFAQLRLID